MTVTMENLAKWIDELAGEIENLKRKAGGGSSVTITPELESGVKIADYTIGMTEGALYAPTQTPSVSPFVDLDVAHRITAGTFENTQLSYTATQDCVVLVNTANIVANTYTAIKVDSGTLWSYSGAGFSVSIPVYLKSGQTVSTVAAGSSQYNSYTVHPLLTATAPTVTKKSRKK